MAAEYIEREATVELLRSLGSRDYRREKGTIQDAIKMIQSQTYTPSADVAPVVRCKNCGHAERYERTDGTAGYYCGHPQNTFAYGERWDRVFKPVKEADDFCSYGKRREE